MAPRIHAQTEAMSTSIVFVEIAPTAEVLARMATPYSMWLSDSEQTRLATLKVEVRRHHYLAGHWLVRELLSQAFGEAPLHWSLQERKSMPPQVINGDNELRISISHSGDWVAAAIANVAIGIDIEQRPRQLDASIESLLLNHGEAAGSLGNDTLLQRWVAKEAWIKAQGESALPARLKQLHLHPATAEFANVSIHSNEAFHFALAIAPASTVTWQRKQKMIPGETYCVSE